MLVQSQSDAYSNFINSIKSDVTKKIYEYNLRLFMEFCSIDKYEDLIGQENKIIPYLMSLRDKKLSFNSISTRLNAIYHFYDMNDVFLNKKKIKMYYDKQDNEINDETLLQDIAHGANVISYHEEKSGEDTTITSGTGDHVESNRRAE